MIKPNETSSPRLLWPDVVRIIAIYLVISLHTRLATENSGLLSTSFQGLVVMGVPLFIMLSGALLLGKQEDYKTFFKKRCMKVLIPWIIWTFLYMIFWFNLNHNQTTAEFFAPNTSPASSWTRFFFSVFMSNLWFLPMIFSIYLITPLIRKLAKHANYSDNLYLIILWFLAVSVLPFLFNNSLFPRWEPNIILSPVYYCGYFLLGYIILKQKLFKINNLFLLFFLGLCPFLISILPFGGKYVQEFTSGFLFPGTVISSIFFFNFLVTASKRFGKYINASLRRVIAAISGASFGVYLIHTMFTNTFEEKIINILRLYHGEFLLTPIIFCLTVIIVLLLQKIPILKKIVP